jgi:cell division protein FtsI/penicillin-binding protein 2
MGALVLGAACLLIVRLGMLHFSDKIPRPDPADRHSYVRRGYIKDANGAILAMSIDARSLYVNPQDIKNPEDVAAKLAPLLGVSEQYVLQRVARHTKRFVWVKRKLTDQTADAVAALDIKGLHFKKEYLRVYPYGTLAANLIGFTNADNYGMEGLEYKFDDALTSYDDFFFKSPEGDFRCGHSVVLTIDRVVQYAAEKTVRAAVEQTGAKQGVIIISETKTGKVLALAKYPTYDPNNYRAYSPEHRNNFTVSEPFEPGSTMKIFSAAAWLSGRKKGAAERWNCTGGIDIMDEHINCTGTHGSVDLYDSIRYSCNVGIISMMKDVSAGHFHSVLRGFGFGERTTRDMAGESSGVLRDLKDWSGLSKYSSAIGQEVSVTSLQMAAAYGAIANDGVYYQPLLVQAVEDERGNVIERTPIRAKGRACSAEIARTLRGMLANVVERGTGKNAASMWYHVAGKTGTAQKSRGGQYVKDLNISSFAGIAPYENPDVSIVVIIDEPKGVTAGSVVAAPYFAKIVDRVLPYRGVTLSPKKSAPPAVAPDPKFGGSVLPDFTGRQLYDAVKMLVVIQDKFPISYNIEGTGKVVRQEPPAGSALSGPAVITLHCGDSDDGKVQE